MIPALAVIVGGYVITSMLQILVKQPKAHQAVFFAAAVTLIATVMALLVILSNASEFTRMLPAELR